VAKLKYLGMSAAIFYLPVSYAKKKKKKGGGKKLKAKLSLCFKWAPRRGGVMGSGGTAPLIL